MAVIKTIISIPSQDATYSIDGDFSPSAVRSMYAEQLPSLANMVDTSSVAAGVGGETRTITFSPRSGNKG